MRHSGAILNMVLKVSIPSFDSMSQHYCHFLPILDLFLHCPFDLSMEYFESHSFTVTIMGVIASLVFWILPWFPQYFLYVLNEILSLKGPLYLSTIVLFKGGSSHLPLKISPFLLSHQNSRNIVSCASYGKKTQWNRLTDCIWNNKSEHTKFT